MNLQSKKHEFMYNSHPLIQVATAWLKICHNWIKERQVIGFKHTRKHSQIPTSFLNNNLKQLSIEKIQGQRLIVDIQLRFWSGNMKGFFDA